MYDIIGDIHGHADKLEELLLKLGYHKTNTIFSHPKRKALFVGDYIDRGPKIRQTLEIIRSMVESDNAIALMGNHEYNALCFHLTNNKGGHLRSHTIKNILQHYQTLKQFQNKQEEYEDYLEWFKTLPLFYETNSFRAVHACWDNDNISYLRKTLCDDRLTDELIYNSVQNGTRLNKAIDQTLKGIELKLPNGLSFNDKDGTVRESFRIKWWKDPSQMSYRSISIVPINELTQQPIDLSEIDLEKYYSRKEKTVFFGHYWLKGEPSFQEHNVCCLDYSVAKQGKLVAYRFENGNVLEKDNLVYV
jgi:hypothetical protein